MRPTLHLAYKIHSEYEYLRRQYAEFGLLERLQSSYSNQKVFFPNDNTSIYWDNRFREDSSKHWMAKKRESIIVSKVDLSRSLLNIGVGNGELEDQLFARGLCKSSYTGTDITHETLSKLRVRYPNASFLFRQLPELRFTDSQFEQILLLEVLEHIQPSNTFSSLRAIHRALNTQGRLIVSIPVNEHLESLLPLNPNEHMRIYSRALIQAELELVGFEITEIIELSAFDKFFQLKHFINRLIRVRQPNNLIILCRKR